jgi:GNAT superfamily N-acetyltransferase
VDDVDALVELRVDLLRKLGKLEDGSQTPAFVAATRQYLLAAIARGDFTAWLAEENGEVIATSGVVLFERPPAPGNLAGREAYLLTMFTLPSWRGKGLGTALMREILDAARRDGIGRLWLHATGDGRPIYEQAGFAPNAAYMELVLPEVPPP